MNKKLQKLRFFIEMHSGRRAIWLVAGFLFVFLLARPAFASDILKVCDPLVAESGSYVCYINHGSPIGAPDGASGTSYLTYFGTYPDASTEISGGSQYQGSNTKTAVQGVVETWDPTPPDGDYWFKLVDVNGSGNDWIFPFSVFSGVYTTQPQGVAFTLPTDTSTTPDFSQWEVSWNDIGTSPSGNFNIKVFWSTDTSILTACSDQNTYGAGYIADCITGSPNVNFDTSPTFSNGVGTSLGTTNITKSLSLTIGQTYYAIVGVYDAGNADLLYQSSQISFTLGTPVSSDTAIPTASCPWYDFLCGIKQGFNWLFSVSPATLNQFSTLTLSGSLPFSYLYDVGNVFNELFANTGTMAYAVSVPFLGSTLDLISASQISAVPYASTIKTILGYLLYFFTAMTLYRMLLKSHSSNHA